MTKVYFACSIRGGRDDAALYADLVRYISGKATVLSEIFADNTLTAQGSSGVSSDIYTKDIRWVQEADVMVAEVTHPSLGVGYEIAKAEEWGKPVLVLFRDDGTRKLSAMIDGSPHLTVVYYKDMNTVMGAIDRFLQTSDVREV